MKPLEGASVKCIEVSMVYPLHRVINYQYLNGTTFVGALKGVSLERSLYKGFTYHMSMVFINRYIDISIHEKYGSTVEGSLLSTLGKSMTYPLSTIEVNKQAKFAVRNYYYGFGPYMVNNAINYYIFWNTLKGYSNLVHSKTVNNIEKRDSPLKNATVGFLTGATVEVIMNPLKIIKTNFQADQLVSLLNYGFLTRALVPRMLLSGVQVAFFNVLLPVKTNS